MIRKYLLTFSIVLAAPCFAIDNPEAKNYVEDFVKKNTVFETEINKCNCTNTELSEKYRKYNAFLDKNLSLSKHLMENLLSGKERQSFNKAQCAWKKFQEKENDFIIENWRPDHFGSSYLLSRFQYMTMIKKQRILSLYYYAKNYPSQ